MADPAEFSRELADLSARFEVLRGDAAQILTAALADVAETIVSTQIAEADHAGAYDTGRYRQSWRWYRIADMQIAVIADPQDESGRSYGKYVHIQPKYGGPPGLADRVWVDIERELERDIGQFLSERLRNLLGPLV